jgi:hypothetical protein
LFAVGKSIGKISSEPAVTGNGKSVNFTKSEAINSKIIQKLHRSLKDPLLANEAIGMLGDKLSIFKICSPNWP